MLLAPRVNLRPHKGSQTAKVNVAAQALSASITRAGIWREVLEFVRLPLPLLRVGRGRFFDRNIWPEFRVFRIQRQPFLKPRPVVRLDRVDRAFGLAYPAVDTLVRMDNEHVLALVEAVDGAHLDAVHKLTANTAIVDDVGQLGVLPADCRGQLIHHVPAKSVPEFIACAGSNPGKINLESALLSADRRGAPHKHRRRAELQARTT